MDMHSLINFSNPANIDGKVLSHITLISAVTLDLVWPSTLSEWPASYQMHST